MTNTDKQIIIDGVDVSGCECYNPNIKMDCLLYPLQSDACKNNPNCHYKLYKRKEQECKELKKANEEKNELLAKLGCPTTATARRKVHILENQIKVLNADKDNLKAKIELIEISNKTTIDNLKRELIDQEAETLKAGGIINCLEKTLAEIKKIINEFAKEDILTFPDFSKEQNYKLIQKQCGEPILKILQKIKELKV